MERISFIKNIRFQKYLFILCFVVLIVVMFLSGYKTANFFSFYNFATKPIVSNFTVTQKLSAPGQTIHWVKAVNLSSVRATEHYLAIPKGANQIKISTTTPGQKAEEQVENIDRQELVKLAKENSQSEASQALAKRIQKEKATGFWASISRAITKASSLFATVGDIVLDDSNQEVTEVTLVDLEPIVEETTGEDITLEEEIVAEETEEIIEEIVEEVAEEEIITEAETVEEEVIEGEIIDEEIVATTTEPAIEEASSTDEVIEEIATTTEDNSDSSTAPSPSSSDEGEATTTEEIIEEVEVPVSGGGGGGGSGSEEDENTPVVENSEILTTRQATTTATTTASSTDIVLVEYETPAPVIAEAETDTGKIVSVSSEGEQEIITNVLAFTTIPEIFKVGQEDKIKIKWSNNNDQNVTFHAYDTDGNGKLDYVEWTVPHLSTQTFEIIFISKAFELDENKEIINDIYDTVRYQDDDYATVPAGHYIRVTFEKNLVAGNDMTIYAKGEGTITVFNENDSDSIGEFTVNGEKTYRIYPNYTDFAVYDLLFSGNIEVDYIVDPDACDGTATDADCWSSSVEGYTWGPTGTVTGVQSTTAGATNTATLASLDGDYPASDYCDALTYGGYYDWYLPAKDQLWAGWEALGSGVFSDLAYWSSTEGSGDDAWYVYTVDPVMMINYEKGFQHSVRCLRNPPPNSAPSATITTPGTWNAGDVTINYKIIDAESNTSNISQTETSGIEYSTDNSTWYDATEQAGAPSEGLTGLTSSADPGTSHVFVWDTATDLSTTSDSTVYIRVRPNDGTVDADAWATTTAFGIDNVAPAVSDSCDGTATDADCWSTQSPSDLAWDTTNFVETGIQSVTDGKANTASLYALGTDYEAGYYCYTLTEDGYPAGTWFLPAKDELWDGWTALGEEVFTLSYHWSSTEYVEGGAGGTPETSAWELLAQFNFMLDDAKGTTNSVRCLRDADSPAPIPAPTFGTITTSSIVVNKPTSVTDAGSGLESWMVRRDSSVESSWIATTTSTYTSESLSDNTEYTYDVRFKDTMGNISAYGTSAGATTTIANTAPTGAFNSATQQTDGTGNVAVSITVSDTENDNSKAKIEYSQNATCASGLTKATLLTDVSTVTASVEPEPVIDQSNAYQIGPTTPILTSSANTVTFVWDSMTDLAGATGGTNYYLCITVNDGTVDQTAIGYSSAIAVDNTASSAPGTPDMTAGTDLGSSSTDNLTSDATPDFTMSCVTGDTVTLYDNVSSVGSDTCADSTITITSSTLSGGTHATMNAKQTDAKGNISSASSNLSITIETTAPTVSTVAVQTGSTVNITFDEAMGTGVTTAGNYTVSGTGKGSLASNPDTAELVSSNTYVLTWSSGEMFNGGDITITVANAQDLAGNAIGSPNSGTDTGGATGVLPEVTGITSVAGDSSATYYDTTDDSSTAVVYTADADAATCKWNTTDVAYDSMANTCASTSSCTLDLSGDGAKTVYMRCVDNAGNKATSSYTLNYTIDSLNPTSAISSPTDNSYSTSTTVALSGVSADTNLSTTTISVDVGSYVATAGTAANWTYSATGLSEGAHTFVSKALDLAGNVGTSTTITVTVDTVAPTLDFVSLYSSNASTTLAMIGDILTLEASSTSILQSTPVITIDGESADVYIGEFDSSGRTWYALHTITGDETEGNMTFTINFADLAGNSGTPVTAVTDGSTVTTDFTVSTGTITLEAGATYSTTTTPTIALTTDDANEYQLCLNSATSTNNCTSVARAWASYTATPTAYDFTTDGLKTLYVQFKDSAGNISATYSDSITVDTVAPTLSEVTPVATPATNKTPTYTFSSTELGTITYGGSCTSTTTSATAGSNTITFNSLLVGTYSTCTVASMDVAGNPSLALNVTAFVITSGGGGGIVYQDCTYEYSDWSLCVNHEQSRTATPNYTYCTNISDKPISQACDLVATTTATTTASTTLTQATSTPSDATTLSDIFTPLELTNPIVDLNIDGEQEEQINDDMVISPDIDINNTTAHNSSKFSGGNKTGDKAIDSIISVLDISSFVSDNVAILGTTTERIVLGAQNILESKTGSITANTITTAGVVIGSVAASGALAMNSTVLVDLLFLPFKLWVLLLSALGLKKRNQPWGTVYDSVTKQPIDPAYVTLKKIGRKGETVSITDLDGRYGFMVAPGKYILSANKTNYLFPSKKMAGKTEDVLYSNLYFGEEINVETMGAVINRNIPLDPIKFDWNEFIKGEKKMMKFYSKHDRFMNVLTDWMFRLGFVVSLLSLFLVSAPYNYIIFGLYIILTAFRKFGLKQKALGSLTEKDGTPLSYAIVRIMAPGLNIEISHKVADQIGRYYCLVPKGRYYVKVDKKNDDESYTTVFTSPVFEAEKGMINKNFVV